MSRKLKLKRWAFLRWYCGWRYGKPMGGLGGGMLPKFGEGEFVSVHRRGPFLELVNERAGGREVIRLVPYQPNHGVMVEMWRDGRCAWRGHCDFAAFAAMGFGEAAPSGVGGERPS